MGQFPGRIPNDTRPPVRLQLSTNKYVVSFKINLVRGVQAHHLRDRGKAHPHWDRTQSARVQHQVIGWIGAKRRHAHRTKIAQVKFKDRLRPNDRRTFRLVDASRCSTRFQFVFAERIDHDWLRTGSWAIIGRSTRAGHVSTRTVENRQTIVPRARQRRIRGIDEDEIVTARHREKLDSRRRVETRCNVVVAHFFIPRAHPASHGNQRIEI